MADASIENAKWSDNQIQSGKVQLKNLLLQWYNPQISTLKAQGAESSFLERQFDIMKRSAHGQLNNIDNKIDRYLIDYARVSKKLNNNWKAYESRLRSKRRGIVVKQMLNMAKRDPGLFYYHLVTVHLFRAWDTNRAGYEASIYSIWSKIGFDNQYLWNMHQLDYIMKHYRRL
jgi:hypothetical protein